MDYLPMTIRRQKNIALIAHDQNSCNHHCYNGEDFHSARPVILF